MIEVCGVRQALVDNLSLLKPGGILVLIGLCHPNSAMDVTAEKIIRMCWTIVGKLKFILCLQTSKTYFLKIFKERIKYLYIICEYAGVYNYRSEHLKQAVDLATNNDYVLSSLELLKKCLSQPITLLELKVRMVQIKIFRDINIIHNIEYDVFNKRTYHKTHSPFFRQN